MYYSKEETLALHQHQMAFVKVSLDGHVLRVLLNRPEKKNAMHPVMVRELAFAFEHARYNPEVRVVVLEAAGDVFCAGADLRAFAGDAEEITSTVPEPAENILMGHITHLAQRPVIAKVQGNAYAGAFLLLCGCTYVVAAEQVKFGLPEVKRGLFPFQVLASLLEIMPAKKALDWCIRGLELGTAEAAANGLVSHVSAADQLDQTVQSLVDDILKSAPLAIRLGLEAYEKIRANALGAEHDYLQEMLFQCLGSEDAREGIMAFKEKRAPNWNGR